MELLATYTEMGILYLNENEIAGLQHPGVFVSKYKILNKFAILISGCC